MASNRELHAADAQLRRQALFWLPAVVLLGAAILGALQWWLSHMRPDGSELHALLLTYAGLSAVLATIAFGLGLSLWRQATDVQREQRFPPASMRTLRDVPIRHGADARRIAQLLQASAVLTWLFGLALLGWLIWSLRFLG